MSQYLEQVAAAVRATKFHSHHSYSWFGLRAPRLTPALVRELSPEGARDHLLATLQLQLYRDCYCRGRATPAARDELAVPADGSSTFLAALSSANSGVGHVANGWTVMALGHDELIVGRDGLEIRARRTDCTVADGGSLEVGSRVAIREPKESRSLSPGFYIAAGDLELEPTASRGLVRLYWNVTPDGAIRLVRYATALLNSAGLPFSLKLVNHPARYSRCDSGILYLHRSDYPAARQIIERLYGLLAADMRQGTPLFTRVLAGGLGLAEDPGRHRSFGFHRCGLLADGLIRAHERGEKSCDGRMAVVVDGFRESGVSLDTPYLNPGSADDFSFDAPAGGGRTGVRPASTAGIPATPARFVRAAELIGQRIMRQAVWSDGRCSWVGPEPQRDARRGMGTITYRPLQADLYSGTAGVGLFLADLVTVTGDGDAQRTAVAATRQALCTADRIPPPLRLGLYSGGLGVALAAARVGATLGREDLIDGARTLLHQCWKDRTAGRESDLMAGDAGAIVALLLLRDMLGDDSLLERAVELGDGLLRTSRHSAEGLGWTSLAFPRRHPLTGFSHGAAGVGYALLQLSAATAERRYHESARLAFAFERHWFDADGGNWADLRDVPRTVKGPDVELPSMVAWCHGAPGIALARLAAYQLDHDQLFLQEAEAALGTTRRAVAAAVQVRGADFSLCHGLGGNAAILQHGAESLDGRSTDDTALVHAAADAGISAYLDRDRAWPCGMGSGESIGLMLGLSGIGHFYLRLYDPTLPSLLAPQRLQSPARQPAAPPAVAASAAPAVSRTLIPRRNGQTLTEKRVHVELRRVLRDHGFDVPTCELESAAATRWGIGCWLRDRSVPRQLPDFCELTDYLAISDADAYLWNSLPYMLAFGYQQATTLQPLVGLASDLVESAASVCAAFSALLSVFDYLVDETEARASVYALERDALNAMFAASDVRLAALVRHYRANADCRVRLLCALFAMCGDGFDRLRLRSANTEAWSELADRMAALFAAERAVTLTRVRSFDEASTLASSSVAKSVGPFNVLLQILALPGYSRRAPELAQTASETLGRAVALADDLFDLLSDCERAAPSSAVGRLAERLARLGRFQPEDEDVLAVIGSGGSELAALLAPPAWADPRLKAVHEFARLTVARWIEWQETSEC